ncbi:MAG TPA: hypothetical protein VN700_07270 [Vicinamibacterales bacterium]|nr:hypothetical protein [Vicinamibacterales bacterium]
MIWTAVAMAETGEIGQARGRDLTVPRPEGDSVSRFGLAMSFAQVPAAMLAPVVESRFGPATSQPVFLVAPFVFVMLAAMFAALTIRELGGSIRTERTAILLSTLAGPLGVYSALDASESLQAASLIVTLWASVRAANATGARAMRASAIAGLAAGVALLTKSSLLVVAPIAWLPFMVGRGRVGKLGVALVAFSVCGAIWLNSEIARFGSPLMGYAGESFSHSRLDGAWRLLTGVNKGLWFYFPALLFAAGRVPVLVRQRASLSSLVRLSSIGVLFALLALASGWWAWHGDDGWGPRLLVPAVPLLAVSAALVLETAGAGLRNTVLVVSVLANVAPLLQHPTPVFHYRLSAAWPEADASFANGLPRFAKREIDGRTRAVPEAVLSTVRQASPFIVLPWYFAATHQSDATARAAMLRQPPWLGARPDIAPASAMVDAIATAPPRWRFWGRSLLAGEIDSASGAYDLGLADQVLRAQSLRSLARAERLARKLIDLAPSGFADALLLESFRLGNRRTEAVQYLNSLSPERRSHPAINVVLALFERDRGNDEGARAFLQSVLESYRDSPVERAISQPLVLWPADLAAMTRDDRLQVDIK